MTIRSKTATEIESLIILMMSLSNNISDDITICVINSEYVEFIEKLGGQRVMNEDITNI